jgi:hypothetical protein
MYQLASRPLNKWQDGDAMQFADASLTYKYTDTVRSKGHADDDHNLFLHAPNLA